MSIKLLSSLFSRKKKLSPLKTELQNLERRFADTEYYMQELEREFWSNGGICCPSCGVPGFSDIEQKQERRMDRIEYLKAKISNSGGEI